MAKINIAKACATCHAELPTPTPEKCPKCGVTILGPANNFFGSPEYLAFQLEHHELDFGDRVRGLGEPKNEAEQKRISAEEKKLAEKMLEVRKELALWVRACPTEDKVAALMDALFVMQNLLHGGVPVEHMRRITAIGKHIGKLAASIEEYFRNGGSTHDLQAGRVLAFDGNDPGGETPTR